MAHTNSERNWCQELGWNKDKKNDINLKCDTVAQHGGWLMFAHTEIFSRAQGDASRYRASPLPHITTKGIPHHHKPPPPRGSGAQVGPLLTGKDVWAFAHLHHLLMGVKQGYAQKKSDVCGCKQLFWKLKIGILKAQSGLTYKGVISASIKIAGNSYKAHLWRCQGDTKPLPSWPCRPGFSAAHLHQQCRLMRRKHSGGPSHALAERLCSVV